MLEGIDTEGSESSDGFATAKVRAYCRIMIRSINAGAGDRRGEA